MKLTPSDRQQLYNRYGGRCAYCGNLLGSKWHADHRAPVGREGHWQGRKGFVLTGRLRHPQNDNKANLEPACIPCNVDKSDSSLEAWRKRLQRSHEILHRNYSTYRHAVRLGVIQPINPPKVEFYFERDFHHRI